eukprot:261184-Amphidinium_carterae.1
MMQHQFDMQNHFVSLSIDELRERCVAMLSSLKGHRLTAFTTEEELNLHTHEKHGDGTLTDKPTIVVGVRSYAQERALNAASGAGGNDSHHAPHSSQHTNL